MRRLYCARGQAENLIKQHKAQLASDRTSCRSPLANQFRLVLHTGAYWLMLALRDAIPRPQPLAIAEFTTLRLRLIKIAARITESPPASASPSPPLAPRQPCSQGSHAAFNRQDHDRGGHCPAQATSRQPQRLQPPKRNRDETGAQIERVLSPNATDGISLTNKTV